MINLTITAESAEEFRIQFSGVSALIAGGSTIGTIANTPAPVEKAAATRTRKPVEPVVTEKPEPDTDPLDIDEPVTLEPVTLEQLRAKATEVSQAGKQPEVKALLLKFEAKSVSTIPEDQRSEFFKALEAL